MPLHALSSAAARSRAARTLMLRIAHSLSHALFLFLSPHTHVGAAECRGFCFAAPVAIALKVPFIPLRKPGKLPSKSIGVDFKQSAGKGAAYFGKDRLEMHEDGLKPGSRVLVIDDMLGTGSTMYGACELVRGGGGIYL